MVHSPFGDAFIEGARFADERGVPIAMSGCIVGELRVPSGRIAVGDPFTTSFGGPPPVLARRAPKGRFPVELAIARFENGDARVACARVRFAGDGAPAVRWEPAGFEGDAPPEGDAIPGYGVDAGMGCFFDAEAAKGDLDEETTEAWLAACDTSSVDTFTSHVADVGDANVVMFSSGWGDGFYASFWGLDAHDGLVELVTDFEILIGPVSERFELPLPPPRGRLRHPLLEAHDVTFRTPLFSRTTVILGGNGSARVELSDGTAVDMKWKDAERHYTWKKSRSDARLIVSVMTGVKPLDLITSGPPPDPT